MRKVNKILMSAVAILLCLVLITTSVVSGIFARFTIYKKSETSVSFQSFGVNVTVSKNPDQKYKDLVVVETNKKGDSITMAIDNIPLNCGSDYSDLIKIKFDGVPTVKVKVSLVFHLNFNNSSEGTYTPKIPAGVGSLDTIKYCMPLGFTFAANDGSGASVIGNTYVQDPWYCYSDGNPSNTLEQYIRNGVSAKIKVTKEMFTTIPNSQASTGNDYGFSATFDPNDKTTGPDVKTNGIHFHPLNESVEDTTKIIKEFVFGFAWPLDWPPEGVENTTGYDYDALSLYLAQNADGKPIKIWYTVKIEQA